MKVDIGPRQVEIAEAFGDIFEGARRRRALSLEVLAKRSGISIQHVGILLSGGQEPKLGTFLRVAAAVGVSPTWLLEETISYANIAALGGLAEPAAAHDTRIRAIGSALTSTLFACTEQDLAATGEVGIRLLSELAKHGLTVVAIPISPK